MSNSYAMGTVSGVAPSNPMAGGLVGYFESGQVSNCYAVSVVSGNPPVGGLIGFYVVGSCSNSFWNTDVIATGIGSGGSSGAT